VKSARIVKPKEKESSRHLFNTRNKYYNVPFEFITTIDYHQLDHSEIRYHKYLELGLVLTGFKKCVILK
jgi:hypothetical protein